MTRMYEEMAIMIYGFMRLWDEVGGRYISSETV